MYNFKKSKWKTKFTSAYCMAFGCHNKSTVLNSWFCKGCKIKSLSIKWNALVSFKIAASTPFITSWRKTFFSHADVSLEDLPDTEPEYDVLHKGD